MAVEPLNTKDTNTKNRKPEELGGTIEEYQKMRPAVIRKNNRDVAITTLILITIPTAMGLMYHTGYAGALILTLLGIPVLILQIYACYHQSRATLLTERTDRTIEIIAAIQLIEKEEEEEEEEEENG